MKILLSPFSQALRNGKENPKNFPYWKELVKMFNDAKFEVIQIGASKDKPLEGITDFRQNLKLTQIRDLVNECDVWISCDSFLQHLCAYYKCKKGIVIWSLSNPDIFGYTRNINLLKSRYYLREHQYWLWEQEDYNIDAFVSAKDVFDVVLRFKI